MGHPVENVLDEIGNISLEIWGEYVNSRILF